MRFCLFLLICLAACGDPVEEYIACGKLLCDPSQYCLQTIGGREDSAAPFDEPVCADAPAACGGTPTCDCVTECTSCTEGEDGSVHCEIALP